MLRPMPRRALLAVVVLVSAARAEPPSLAQREAPSVPPPGSLLELRVRAALGVRGGSEVDTGPGISYSGVTPNDVALSAAAFPFFERRLGLVGSFQREGLSLWSQGQRLTQGALLRGGAGLAGQLRFFERLGVEASVGWSYAEVAQFGSVAPTFRVLPRHAVLLAARTTFDLGPVTLEARAEVPITVATVVGTRSGGVGVGVAGRLKLFQSGPLDWGGVVEAQWQRDVVTGTGLSLTHDVLHAGLALDVRWREVTPASGTLVVETRLEGHPAPLSLRLETASGLQTVTSDEHGAFQLILPPGAVSVSADVAGHVSARSEGTVLAGGVTHLSLDLAKDRSDLGGLRVRVVVKGVELPPNAQVSVQGVTRSTDQGVVQYDDLKAGPLAVAVEAPEYAKIDEAAVIVAGHVTELEVTLVPLKAKVPAVVRGFVRSARTGAPVKAKISFGPQLTVSADKNGAFQFEVPGGRLSVIITAPDFQVQRKTLVVHDGDQTILNVDLSPQ